MITIFEWSRFYINFLPPLLQQLPGPSQLAWCGCEPQQPVSPTPGNRTCCAPDKDEWADINFLRFGLPQIAHCGWSDDTLISSSLTFPQSSQWYSYRGIRRLLSHYTRWPSMSALDKIAILITKKSLPLCDLIWFIIYVLDYADYYKHMLITTLSVYGWLVKRFLKISRGKR